MTWKKLGDTDGHGFGYVEYWDFSDTYPHAEHPKEITDDDCYDFSYVGNGISIKSTSDNKYDYVIQHRSGETYNYFRYKKE